MNKEHLIKLFYEHGAVKRGSFTLASGKVSEIYIDCKQLFMDAASLQEVALEMAALISNEVGAAHLAADDGGGPLLGAILIDSWPEIKAAWLRKQKDHGTKTSFIDRIPAGESCVVIEDVLTSGQSAYKVVDVLTAHNHPVSHVFCLVDRQEGGQEFLLSKGIKVYSLLNKTDLLAYERR